MKYVFIDTNIYLGAAHWSAPNDSSQAFKHIDNLMTRKDIKFLMPEIVSVEFTRNIDDIHEKTRKEMNVCLNFLKEDQQQQDKKGNKVVIPRLLANLDYERKIIVDRVNLLAAEREKSYQTIRKKVYDFIESASIQFLPVTSEIFIRAYMRLQKRLKPFKKKDMDILEDLGSIESAIESSKFNDSIIVETLGAFFASSPPLPKDVLMFCTDNIKDFATEDGMDLHPDIKDDFRGVKVKFYRELPQMLKNEFHKEITAAEIEEISTAMKYIEELRRAAERPSARSILTHYLTSQTHTYDVGPGTPGDISELLRDKPVITKVGGSLMDHIFTGSIQGDKVERNPDDKKSDSEGEKSK